MTWIQAQRRCSAALCFLSCEATSHSACQVPAAGVPLKLSASAPELSAGSCRLSRCRLSFCSRAVSCLPRILPPLRRCSAHPLLALPRRFFVFALPFFFFFVFAFALPRYAWGHNTLHHARVLKLLKNNNVFLPEARPCCFKNRISIQGPTECKICLPFAFSYQGIEFTRRVSWQQ